MLATDIIDLLEDIGRSATPRLSPAVHLSGNTPEARRNSILQMIRGTVLPRRLEFSANTGTSLAIEVNNSRITDVYSSSTGAVPDFETEAREALIEKLARLISNLAEDAPTFQVVSLQPDTALEVDDVGITFSEIQKACSEITLTTQPHVSIVQDSVSDADPEDAPSTSPIGLAEAFFARADRFGMGRILTGADGSVPQFDGICAGDQPLHPEDDVLTRLANDLAGWDADSAEVLAHPQLIVMRPSGGKGAALALLREDQNTAVAVHDARKLGAVVSLWKSFRGARQ